MEQKKQEVRFFHKQKRDAMQPREILEKSKQICGRILQSGIYENCSILYAYFALGNEVDCREVVQQAFCDGKTVALPKTLPDSQMEFYRIASLCDVAEGKFHVMEPLINGPPLQYCNALVLVPGVVFDEEGGRYGYGKGYYDRYFKRYPKLRRAGVAYAHQMERSLLLSDHDQRMHVIFTESSVYETGHL